MKHNRPTLRVALTAALSAVAGIVLAQSGNRAPPPPPMPPQLETLPEVAPPAITSDPELEPQVTITRKEGETVEEARINGKLIWIKVTPRHGKPYFLIPDGGDGVLLRRDSLDPGLRVPLWVLFSF